MPTRPSGEWVLIEQLARVFGPPPSEVVQGIGDDCAVIQATPYPLLLSCDLAIEDIHFRRAAMPPEDIGYRAAAAAFSDMAAMGGTPLYGLVALACPGHIPVDFIEAVYCGLADAAAAAGARIVGGDTTISPSGLVLDVSVVGEAREGRCVLRNGAQAGDVLAVTGRLGRSAAGLHALEHGLDAPELIAMHRRPQPRYTQSRWLCREPAVHAMIDVSDGLAQDAGHVAEASGLGLDIQSSKLLLDDDLRRYCKHHGLDPLDLALAGGEDYELAVAVAVGDVEQVCRRFTQDFVLPLTPVGVFTNSPAGIHVDGQTPTRTGYEHFRP